jgi:hypothetical protein
LTQQRHAPSNGSIFSFEPPLFQTNSTINTSNQYDTKQIHCTYRYLLLLLRLVIKRGFDPRWNNTGGTDSQFRFFTGSGG